MLEKIAISVGVAWSNIIANPLHTVLSTLGIVIGVAALVSILSLADGMEQFAREQIESTTSVQAIGVETLTLRRVDEIWVEVEDYPVLMPADLNALLASLEGVESVSYRMQGSGLFHLSGTDRSVGARYMTLLSDDPDLARAELLAGRMFDELTETARSSAVILNRAMAGKLSEDFEALIGSELVIDEKILTVAAVIGDDPTGMARAVIPVEAFSEEELRETPPGVTINAARVEEVPQMEQAIMRWLDTRFEQGSEGFRIYTNQMRVEQAQRGILLFKVIMGLITGISVLVGGIGVMNVLLVSITERTSEIGIRKATGAKKRDIMLQFLSESVTISSLGSAIGLLLGIAISLAAVPLVKIITDITIQVAFTFGTFATIGVIALVIGIVFGTWPAVRAARLMPIDAIRRE